MVVALIKKKTDEERAQAAALKEHQRGQGARRLMPWASSPYLQLALVYEQDERLAPALRSIREAIDRDQHNWSLWVVRSRLETKSGAIREALRSLKQARRLNPHATLPNRNS